MDEICNIIVFSFFCVQQSKKNTPRSFKHGQVGCALLWQSHQHCLPRQPGSGHSEAGVCKPTFAQSILVLKKDGLIAGESLFFCFFFISILFLHNVSKRKETGCIWCHCHCHTHKPRTPACECGGTTYLKACCAPRGKDRHVQESCGSDAEFALKF